MEKGLVKETASGVAPSLKGKDCLSLSAFPLEAIELLTEKAMQLKKQQVAGKECQCLNGKSLAMIFDKPSTRTRISFEVGMKQLGGHTLHLHRDELQLSRGETLQDTARILSGYVDAVLIRTFTHELVAELAEHASIPVINGLTDLHHPCQALADLLTLKEEKGHLKGLKLAYIGDGNNVFHSLLEAAAATGIHLVAAIPKGYDPNETIVQQAVQTAVQTGATISFTRIPEEAVAGADAVYTDVWSSMGQEEEEEKRIQDFQGFQVNEKLMSLADSEALFLHCLPAHRGLEVTAEVMEGPHSVVFQQAENRLHAQKALLAGLLG
ncbi:ornithine carbamoyltransferase [Melghirimyces algeriensis]|nr:ornithine carbamoyltransferase [Melghirimyces algeriensis]